MTIGRPVMRYFGGKFRLRDWVLEHFPPHKIYVEPYGGAASVLMQKTRSPLEILNDLDEQIVSVFRVLRDPERAQRLTELCRLTPFSRTELALLPEPGLDEVENARRLIYRCFAGIGLYRKLSTGFRGALQGRGTGSPAQSWFRYPDAIASFTARLAGVTLENRSAIEVMVAADKPYALHYVDPPYLPSSRTDASPSSGYPFDMDEGDHVALAHTLRELEGAVVLSGYPSALYDDLFGDWYSVTRRAFAERAGERTEVLWLNPVAQAGLSQQKLAFVEDTGAA